MEDQHAFIDEFGNPDLEVEKQGVTTHFIISAVIVDENKIIVLDEKLEKIRKKFFQTGEIRSKKVGNNDVRRRRILNELCELDFHVYAIIVDKRKVYSGGLKHKHVFLKYLHGIVDGKLYNTYPNLKISADEHGRKEFMDGFKAYVVKNHIPNLFNESEFGFVDSKSVLLVQAADFICGTLARCFDETVRSENGLEFLKILKRRIIYLVPWPEEKGSFIHDSEKDKKDYNAVIAEYSANTALVFINKHENSKDPVIKDQVNCLRYLLFYYQYINPYRYVKTRELKENVGFNKSKDLSTNYLRSSIIAKLRDSDVLISSSELGYKLPVNEKDLYDFINHSNRIIFPMLERLERCRKGIKLVTKNALDIFEQSGYVSLKRYFDS